MKGKWVCMVKFSHAPDLKGNLLSYFYFIYNKSFKIYILSYTIFFRLEESGLFTTTINYANSAILNKTTITSEITLSIFIISVNLSL